MSDDIKAVYTIEKDVPVPVLQKRQAAENPPLLSTIKEMEIGDSIYLASMSVKSATGFALRGLGKGCYVIRKEREGYRIWRTK